LEPVAVAACAQSIKVLGRKAEAEYANIALGSAMILAHRHQNIGAPISPGQPGVVLTLNS